MIIKSIWLFVACYTGIVRGYLKYNWNPYEVGENCADGVVNFCDDCGTASFCTEGIVSSSTQCLDGNACYTNGEVTACIDISNVPGCQCPDEGETVIADPYDNQKFILCLNGEGTLESCAEDLYFNPVTGKCDLTEAPTPPTTKPPLEMCYEDGSNAADVVSVSCTSYRICHSDYSTEAIMECDSGYLFDTDLNECVKYEPFSCPNENEANYYADNHNCSVYYLCYQGEIAGQTFYCAEGYEFDNAQQTCVGEEDSTCTPIIDCGICPNQYTTFEIDCERYYQCTENPDYDPEVSADSTNLQYIPVVQECDSGFYFYPDTGECLSSVPGCPAAS